MTQALCGITGWDASCASLLKLTQLKAVTDYSLPDVQPAKHDTSACRGCALGKAHHKQYHDFSSEPPTTCIMEKAVADLCGPIRGYYVSTITDVHSSILRDKVIYHLDSMLPCVCFPCPFSMILTIPVDLLAPYMAVRCNKNESCCVLC